MARHPALRDRIAAGILDTAASVLAERGELASMAEIAEAAGVGRATLYRYFPSRDALLTGLAQAAFEEVCERIADAQLDKAEVREGIARLARGFVTAGSKYIALIRTGQMQTDKSRFMDEAEADRRMAEPVRELLKRGIEDGTLRSDWPPEVLMEMFTALLEKGFLLVTQSRLGIEGASAAITSMFLDGAAAKS